MAAEEQMVGYPAPGGPPVDPKDPLEQMWADFKHDIDDVYSGRSMSRVRFVQLYSYPSS